MELIVCVDKNWGIGCKGQLLCPISEDLKHFKELTLENTIILGDRTLTTFPKGKPLPKRENIILSLDPDFRAEGAVIVHSIPELLEYVKNKENVFVAGGASVYRQLLPYCSRAHVTRLNKAFPADAFFPDLTALPQWELTEESQPHTAEDVSFTFCIYTNKKIAE